MLSPLGVPRPSAVSVQQPEASLSGPQSPDTTCHAIKHLCTRGSHAKPRPVA